MKNKAIVTAIGTTLVVAYVIIGGQLGLPALPEWVYGALAGLGIAINRDALKALVPAKEEPAEKAQ